MLLYLLPPFLIILDESVLQTHWIGNHIPLSLSPLFRNALFGGLCLCLTGLSILYIALFEHYRRREVLGQQI